MLALHQLFSLVCGQANLWSVGGQTLPACQRCTGLYTGAVLAFVLWLAFRPRPTPSRLWAHGIALLVMLPFGYHLVAHGCDARTLTGFVFGIGLVYFLLLLPAARLRLRLSDHSRAYTAGLFAGAALLMLAIHFGGIRAAEALAGMSAAGLVTLASLSVANLLLLPRALRRATSP